MNDKLMRQAMMTKAAHLRDSINYLSNQVKEERELLRTIETKLSKPSSDDQLDMFTVNDLY